MPAKKSPSAKPTVKKATKKAAPKSRNAPQAKKAAVPPTEARPLATSATPGRVMTRGRGQKREVVGVVSSITADDIALRAYYISERRQHLGLPGDAQSDWLEAEKQLRS